MTANCLNMIEKIKAHTTRNNFFFKSIGGKWVVVELIAFTCTVSGGNL